MSTINVITNQNGKILDCGMLYKIINNKYLSDFIKGRIYMKNLLYYTKMEENAIGDKHEGLAFFGNEGKILYKNEVIALCKDVNIYANLEKPVFCTSIPNFNKVGNEYKYTINKFAIDEMTQKKYNNFSLVFIKKEEFVSRIEKSLIKCGYSATCGKVIYTNSGYKLDEIDVGKNAGFVKRKKYEYQNEYRIMINKIVKDYFILDIGNINDIIKVFKLDGKQEVEMGIKFK